MGWKSLKLWEKNLPNQIKNRASAVSIDIIASKIEVVYGSLN